ncbi:hypothetical protein [uncultured Novosphingobium sp.]|uniref:hypothetical protein n=1 Tax=uncultured Novosphingobium sp. TaxID=292277 RepID=UPI00258A86D2|nr:hypothetical protein [uncultured Novosphingobium sp.]
MLWHFEMSPSDLKQLKVPTWLDPDRRRAPTMMLFSVVDGRSGIGETVMIWRGLMARNGMVPSIRSPN